MLYFNLKHLNLLALDFEQLIANGEISPHSVEGKELLKVNTGPAKDMNEAQVRQSFVLPLLEILGWNKQNPLEVVAEERVNGGYLDIKLVYDGKTKFVIEIKRPSVDLDISSTSGKLAAYQGVGYGRSFAEAPIIIVTNFERLNIYHSYTIPQKTEVNINLLGTFLWKDYLTEEIQEVFSHFTKQACIEGENKIYFDKLIKNQQVIRMAIPLNEKILKDFERWRLDLGKSFYKIGLTNVDLLNHVVQKVLDKLILIRNIQDRGLDSSLGDLKSLASEEKIGEKLAKNIFPYFKEVLSKEFFHVSEIETFYLQRLPDFVLKKIILNTYGENEQGDLEDFYDFSVIPIELLGFAYEQYLGKVFFLDDNNLRLEFKSEVQKTGGVCYTPSFVVDYIVDLTFDLLEMENVKGRVDEIVKYKFLDLSCGSGSFLIRLFSQLIQVAHTVPNKKSIKSIAPDLSQKKEILEKCIFGVDIDARAVEITKFSLILKLLEGEVELTSFVGSLIPSLSKNIRNGNSLIGPRDLKTINDIEVKQKIKPLEWDMFKRDVAASEGFSAIIGNPPYIRNQVFRETYPMEADILMETYASYKSGNVDLYLPFVEKSLKLLRKNGVLAYIIPHRFWNADYGESLRNYMKANCQIKEILNYRAEQVFIGVTTYTTIMGLQAKVPEKDYKFKYIEGRPFIGADLLTQLATEAKHRDLKNENILIEDLSSEILLEKNWFFAPNEIRKKIIKLESNALSFSDFLSDEGLYQGVIAGGDELLISCEEWGDRPLNKFLVKMLKGSRDMKAFTRPRAKQYLIYPYIVEDGTAHLASLVNIRQIAPDIANRLKNKEKALRSRISLKTATQRKQDLSKRPHLFKKNEKGDLIWNYLEKDYYKYVRNQALISPKKSKVLVPSLFKRPTFIPDLEGEYVISGSGTGGGGGYIFTLKDEYLDDLKSIIAVLGSDLLKLWFERRGDLFQGYYIGVDKKSLKNVPIPFKNITNEEKGLLARYCDDLFSCEDKKSHFYEETLNSLSFLVEILAFREA